MKKAVCFALCFIMACTSLFVFGACSKEPPLKIVYLGDSIAEGLAGSSPLSERENYAYYAILGRCNEFVYYNRSVSGHKTDDMLKLIKKGDENALMTETHIKEADILHISILGNDILLSGFPEMLIEAAEDKYDKLETILPTSRKNIKDIVERLRSLNPDAIMIFQTVYNPADPQSILITSNVEAVEVFTEMGIKDTQYRELAAKVINRLNNVLWDYLKENPNAFYISDVYKAYDEVYKADRERGNRLIFGDWVHPSNEGHALAALTNQTLLESLGAASNKFLSNYKKIRIEQLERMFSDTVDYKKISKDIKKAKTYQDVSMLYFDAIKGITPQYC